MREHWAMRERWVHEAEENCTDRYHELEGRVLDLYAKAYSGNVAAIIEIEVAEAQIDVYRRWSGYLSGQRFKPEGRWFSSPRGAGAEGARS